MKCTVGIYTEFTSQQRVLAICKKVRKLVYNYKKH